MPSKAKARGLKDIRKPDDSVQVGSPKGEIVLYSAPDGTVSLDVKLEQDTIWLSLNQMTALFERDKSVISRHLRNVFREGELERMAVVAFFATTNQVRDRVFRVNESVQFLHKLHVLDIRDY